MGWPCGSVSPATPYRQLSGSGRARSKQQASTAFFAGSTGTRLLTGVGRYSPSLVPSPPAAIARPCKEGSEWTQDSAGLVRLCLCLFAGPARPEEDTLAAAIASTPLGPLDGDFGKRYCDPEWRSRDRCRSRGGLERVARISSQRCGGSQWDIAG